VLKGINKSTKIVEGYHQAHEQQYAGSIGSPFHYEIHNEKGSHVE